MTVTITGTLKDVSGQPDNTIPLEVASVIRFADDGSVITEKPVIVRSVAGRVRFELEPGFAEVRYGRKVWRVTAPGTDSTLKALIEAAVAFPPDSAQMLLDAAVEPYVNAQVPPLVQSITPAVVDVDISNRNITIQDVGSGNARLAIGGVNAGPAFPLPGGAWSGLVGRDEGVKQATGGIVPLERFNPDAGFAAALSAAIAEADATGGVVRFANAKTYTVNAMASVTDKHVRIDFNGAKLVRPASMANTSVLQISYSTSTPQSVVGLTSTTYDWGGQTAFSTPVTRIELSSTAGWAAGDWAVVVGDDSIPGANPSDAQREGERVRVAAIVGNYLYLARRIRVTLTTNVRVARMTLRDCILLEPWVEDAADAPATRNVLPISIYQAVKPRVVRAKGQNLACEAIAFFGCTHGVVEGGEMHNIRTDFTYNAFGYGFRLQSCNDFFLQASRGSFLRHLITTGAQFSTAANSPDMWRYGSNLGHRTFGGNAGEVGHAAFDTHEEAAFVTYDSCFVGWNHREVNGGFGCFKIRGRHNEVINSVTYGGCAVELSSFEGGGDHKIVGHTHTVPPGVSDMGASYRVNYSDRTTTRGKAIITGCKDIANDAPGQRVLARNCVLDMPTHEITVTPATNQVTLFQVENSEVRIGTLTVDLRGIGNIDPRIFFVNDSTSTVRVERLVVLTGGQSWRVAHLNDLNGLVVVGRIETDTLPSTSLGGFTNVGASATTQINDIILNQRSVRDSADFRGANSAFNMSPYSASRQVLSSPITADRAITESSYPLGKAGAEILFVRTSTCTGAYSYTFSDDSLSSPGTWLRRMWNGTAWTTSAKGTYDGGVAAITVASFTNSAITTEAERILANDNDTSLPTSAAVLDLVQKFSAAQAPSALLSGYYYHFTSAQSNSTSSTLTADRARTSAVLVTVPTSIASLTAEFSAAGDAASVFRIGIWNDDGYGRPGTLRYDAGSISTGTGNAGTVATGGTPGHYEIATAGLVLQPGLYHVGGAVQGVTTTQPTMRTIDGARVPHTGPSAQSLGTNQAGTGWYKDGFTGALGDITTPAKNVSNSASAPRIGFKAA